MSPALVRSPLWTVRNLPLLGGVHGVNVMLLVALEHRCVVASIQRLGVLGVNSRIVMSLHVRWMVDGVNGVTVLQVATAALQCVPALFLSPQVMGYRVMAVILSHAILKAALTQRWMEDGPNGPSVLEHVVQMVLVLAHALIQSLPMTVPIVLAGSRTHVHQPRLLAIVPG
jgi:hypothetical protein